MESSDMTGLRVWVSASDLSTFYIRSMLKKQQKTGPKLICELGAGTGACSIRSCLATAPQKDTFVLTDRKLTRKKETVVDSLGEVEVETSGDGEGFEILKRNVERNSGVR